MVVGEEERKRAKQEKKPAEREEESERFITMHCYTQRRKLSLPPPSFWRNKRPSQFKSKQTRDEHCVPFIMKKTWPCCRAPEKRCIEWIEHTRQAVDCIISSPLSLRFMKEGIHQVSTKCFIAVEIKR